LAAQYEDSTARAEAADPPDAALLERLASDPSALEILYDRYSRLVYGLALRALGSVDAAQDLTQEVFLGLRDHTTYDPSRGTLAAYLITVTRTRAIDQLRFGTRKVRLLQHWWQSVPTEPSPSPVDQLSVEQCAARVNAALADLAPSERKALELAYYKGLSQTEVAEEMGAPLGTVKSWSRRGLLAMREALADLVE
jgi:RNA polymerase sigma-70 factor (ECF subfamily)